MARFVVEWIERTPRWADVDADSEADAIVKAKRGEVVEGSQDSEPGTMDRRSVRISSQPSIRRDVQRPGPRGD